MSLLEFFRGKVFWAVTCEKEALQETATQVPDLVIFIDELEQGVAHHSSKNSRPLLPTPTP